MAIQFVKDQIKDLAIDNDKLANSTIAFGKFAAGTLIKKDGTFGDNDDKLPTVAAVKQYVDNTAQGLDPKESCRVATTASITIASDLNVGDAIDGVTLADGDRVLVKDQSTASQNGIYLAGASPARAADFAVGSEEKGAFAFIEEGTTNADSGWVCTSDGAAIVGTDAMTFAQFSGAGQIVAGAALTKSGNTLNVAVDSSSIEVSSDALRVKALGVTNGMLAGSIANAKLSNSTVSFGGVSLALGASDGTPAFNLSDATAYPTSSLVGTITNAQLAGSIANDKLANSTISGKALGANLDALAVDDSSIEYSAGSAFNGSAASTIRVKANGVTNGMLAGSIADSKLSTIVTPNKVSGVAVQLATASALEDSTGLRLKATTAGDGLALSAGQVLSVNVDDSSLETNSDSLRVKALGITDAMLAGSISNAKLANSTISGKALGANLDALAVDDSSIEYSAGSAFNGSAASTIRVKANGVTNAMLAGSIADSKMLTIASANKVSGSAVQLQSNKGLEDSTGLGIKLDGSSMTLGAGGVKVSDLGVGTGQLANSAVTLAKVGFTPQREDLSGMNGVLTAFNLSNRIQTAAFVAFCMVYRNGQVCFQKAGSPDGASEYTIADSGGSTTITFGGAPAATDQIQVLYFY